MEDYRPLTKEEIRRFRERLLKWQSLDEFNAVLEEWHEISGGFSIIQPGSDTYRDGWIAAHFAKAVAGDRLRLVGADRPDFEMEIRSRVSEFEATEADIPGRRRGQEYWQDWEMQHRGESTVRDHNAPGILRREVGNMLRGAAENKSQIGYGTDCNLVIYLNPGDFDWYHEEILSSFIPSTERAGRVFRSVCILWKEVAYCAWRLGSENPSMGITESDVF
jgi:hypothetical protein